MADAVIASTLIDVIENGAATHPALVAPDGPTLTYSELREQVSKLMGQLRSFGIEQAQTRATMDGDVCGPEERVDLVTALRMHTINGAYASFEEHSKGSIETGKFADLALLSTDIREVPATELRDLPIDMTIIGGRMVYERG